MNQIRKIRLDRKIQQKNLATHLGVHARQVQRYEKNNDSLSVSKAIIIADYLDVPLDLLFNRPEHVLNNYDKNDFMTEEQLLFKKLNKNNQVLVIEILKLLLDQQN